MNSDKHRALNDALHDLHLRAGRPSLSVMARELREAGISRSTIHDAFSSERLPQWPVVDALIEILAQRAPGENPEDVLSPMHALWLSAAEADRPADQPRRKRCTLLLFSIQLLSSRTDPEQERMRTELNGVIDHMLASAAIEGTQRRRIEYGDSQLEIVDPGLDEALLRTLIEKTPGRLHLGNSLTPDNLRVRLLLVMTHGRVSVGRHGGWLADDDLKGATRLLDSEFLRSALHQTDSDLALCLSDEIYQGVVRHGHQAIRPNDFQPATADTKIGTPPSWLYVAPKPEGGPFGG